MANDYNLRSAIEAIPAPLAIWVAVSSLKKAAHFLDDFNNENYPEVLKLQISLQLLAKKIKAESDERKAAKAKANQE